MEVECTLFIEVIWQSVAVVVVGQRDPSPQPLCHCSVSILRGLLPVRSTADLGDSVTCQQFAATQNFRTIEIDVIFKAED